MNLMIDAHDNQMVARNNRPKSKWLDACCHRSEVKLSLICKRIASAFTLALPHWAGLIFWLHCVSDIYA